ncbi:GTP 3',8-cyclase MoaA [Candidatus Bathyarchaeota archaeon]|nr:GTP 3',8-cyclase MoaA [Candidatus Bathyarchaeota archaeon]
MYDRYGRPTLNFRISVTQRCNLKCPYCHREGQTSTSSIEMTPEEIGRLVRIGANLGITDIKLTGGEPLLRSDIADIIREIAMVPKVTDLSITTNGTLLAENAAKLKEAGLRRVNVNFLTLNSDTYRDFTGGNLEDVIKGVEAASRIGLNPIKLNVLLLRGVNDGELGQMLDYARQVKAILQIIELEPVNISSEYYAKYHQPLIKFEALIKEQAVGVKFRRYMQNRKIYHLVDVDVEFVRPIENTEFCAHCTRLRLTSDGKLKPCLMRNDNLIDVLTPLRQGVRDTGLIEIFKEAINKREPYFKSAV